MGSYAHAIVDQDQQKSVSAKGNQEKKEKSSDKGDFDDEPKETINRLDLFHAFSLVNAQLRWKEFYIEKNVKSIHDLAKTQNIEQQNSDDLLELFDSPIQIAALPTPNPSLFISTEDFQETHVSDFPRCLNYHASTIAYILNCGTYPSDRS
jgi:hypothetical protein